MKLKSYKKEENWNHNYVAMPRAYCNNLSEYQATDIPFPSWIFAIQQVLFSLPNICSLNLYVKYIHNFY